MFYIVDMEARDQQLFELRRRTFDTPHFRGIEFLESEAKSIINKVPGGGLPFDYTINPYRGCSHACAYCVHGSTPVLMGDGRTKLISELQVGDEIYGTVRRGSYRRYVKTRVLAHWSTVKPAYRTTLEDGTELITSGDHRFLSNRGWKFVTGTEHGPGRRPHLTRNNKLMGVGGFAEGPVEDDEYRRGYLCGMIRGDGHVGSYSYPRAGRAHGDVHRFRLALVDQEALRRSREYLARFGVPTSTFLFSEASGPRKAVHGIRSSARAHVEAVGELTSWRRNPSLGWCKGFLAGIFDAEGSFSGALRIVNGAPDIIEQVVRCLTRLGFDCVVEPPQPNGCQAVRLLGGLREILRLFHTVDPAITRKRDIAETAIKSDAPLTVASVDPLGVELPMYDITTGTGDFIANGVVSHNCFARVTHTYMDMDAGRDFESKIVVKVNAPELLRRELARQSWKGEHIAMGTATDPYQRAEGRYRLMPGIIRALTDYRNPFSILTKGTLILRDLDLLREAAEVTEVSTAFSIGTLDEDVWRRSEPGTPHPRKRIEAVAKLNRSGIPCGVMVAPVLPGISDSPEQLAEVVRAAVDAGATHVSPILLHLRPVVREEYMAWLRAEYPGLVGTYEELYAKGSYAPKADRRALGRRVSGLVRAAGGLRPPEHIAGRWRRDPADERRRREAEEPEMEQPSLL